MDISVIITVKEDRGWVQNAIDSAKNQRFDGDMEIILAIDGNASLVKVAKANNISYILNKKPLNLARNFNNGASIASGRYLKVLADDDMLMPGSLNALFSVVKKLNPEYVFSDFKIINENGDITGEYIHPYGDYENLYDMLISKKIGAGGSLVKTDIFRKLGGLDERFSIAEFYIYLHKLLKAGYSKIYYTPYFSYMYRHHNNQKSLHLSAENKIKRLEEMALINKTYIS